MKKLLLVLLTVMVSSVTFAQIVARPVCREAVPAKGVNDLPTWTQLTTLFTLTDINNNTINLADTLAAGKALVIDYSATWCSWCWVMHQNGILEAIYEDLGDQVCVLWIEADQSTGAAGITGGSGSQGDWTNGGTVPYPIVDDYTAANFIGGNITGFPTVVFVSPSGYWCDVYGTPWGFGPYYADDAVDAISALLDTYPRANQAPIVEIGGYNTALVNSNVTFTSSIVSVDNIVSIDWTVSNGATFSDVNSITTSFSTVGTETVILTVTNTTGTTSDTLTVTVFDWTWGDEMDYTNGGSMYTAYRVGSNTTWGVKYPVSLLGGRHYIDHVSVYSNDGGTYTLMIYQPNVDDFPATSNLLYQCNYTLTANGYNDLPIYDHLAIDDLKDLWVVFQSGDGYPAAVTDYTGDPNSTYVMYQNRWMPFRDLSDLDYTWMIKTTTSDDAPFHIAIDAPATALSGDPVTFTALAPSSASVSWDIQGGTPSTSTSPNVDVVFAAGGTYTVTLTATLDGETLTSTHRIVVSVCNTETLPFSFGFEANDDIACWKFYDADGDGEGWFEHTATHSGSVAMASASYINGYGALNPDNWMVTSKVTIPAEGATISWWEYGQDTRDFADNYAVYVSTTGNSTADFSTKIFEGAPQVGQTWTKRSANINGNFAGQDVYIAFRHYNITDMYILVIDDISITTGTTGIDEAAVANVSIYPNPTSGMLFIDAEGVEEINVVDVNGRVVMNEKNTNSIDITNISEGVYFVRVITANGVATQKIVKK